MVGPDLRKLSKEFADMPIEEFLARLVRSMAPGASVMVVGITEEKGPEVDSKSALPVSGVAGGGHSETTVAFVKDKERKRHRDGSSSRSHHSKKFKEPMMPPSSELALSAKIGAESEFELFLQLLPLMTPLRVVFCCARTMWTR